MIATLVVLVIYLSFVIDFVILPIPSEASTFSILQQKKSGCISRNVLLIPMHVIVLIIWLSPLVVAVETLFLTQSCFFSCILKLVNITHSPYFLIAGIVTACLGRAITFAGSIKLRRAQPGKLVTEGIFSFTRHPIVTGLHITLFGLMLLTGSVTSLIALPFVIFYFDQKVKHEELHLQQKFGEFYNHYRSNTMRY